MRHQFYKFNKYALYLVPLLFLSLYFSTNNSEAAKIDDLRINAEMKASEIKILEDEIKKLDNDLKATNAESKSLSGTIQTLEKTSKKLSTDIVATQKKVVLSELTLEELTLDIASKNLRIKNLRDGMGEILRERREEDDRDFFEELISPNNVSDFWDSLARLSTLENSMHDRTVEIGNAKAVVVTKKEAESNERSKLVNLKGQLSDKKTIAENNKKTNAKLLIETKNKESTYKKLLAGKQAKFSAVERELANIEAQIKFELDPSTFPPSKKGTLSWPLKDIFVTQKFGNTEFSRTSAGAIYNGKGHNGVDFRASIGTAVTTASPGVVLGTGNTDSVCSGASYGKWILVGHPNGLTSLYAHLSLIKVSQGQKVSEGALLGYSGETGYAFGPHLHFSLFVSPGVRITSLKSKVRGCGTYTLPLAAYSSYLDPLGYF